MTVGDTTAEAIALYDQFVQANTCQSILSTFQQLCDCLDIHPLDEGWFYNTLKSKYWRIQRWCSISLFLGIPNFPIHFFEGAAAILHSSEKRFESSESL